MTADSKFTLTLPSQDTAGAALVAGQITQVIFVITDGAAPAQNFPYTIPAGTAVGATISVPFSAIGFTPTAGQSYGADVIAVDANGDSPASNTGTWTQAAVPAAPTNFTVS